MHNQPRYSDHLAEQVLCFGKGRWGKDAMWNLRRALGGMILEYARPPLAENDILGESPWVITDTWKS